MVKVLTGLTPGSIADKSGLMNQQTSLSSIILCKSLSIAFLLKSISPALVTFLKTGALNGSDLSTFVVRESV